MTVTGGGWTPIPDLIRARFDDQATGMPRFLSRSLGRIIPEPDEPAVTRVQGIVEPINRLLESARAAGVARFIVRTEHSEETNSPAWLWRAGRLNNETVRAGSWGAELYRITPGPGDVVVTKHRYSAFVGTDLFLRLRSAGVGAVVLSGTVTNVCLESTARDALMNDLFVVLAEDAVGATREEDHRTGLTSVRDHFGLVCPERGDLRLLVGGARSRSSARRRRIGESLESFRDPRGG